MVTIKTRGNLHHLFIRDRNLRHCFTDIKAAEAMRDKLNEGIKAKLVELRSLIGKPKAPAQAA